MTSIHDAIHDPDVALVITAHGVHAQRPAPALLNAVTPPPRLS